MKRTLICILLIVSMLQIPVVFAQNTDDDFHSASLVSFLDNLGITNGIDTLDLTRSVTRGEFVAMVVRMYNSSISSEITGEFYDVDDLTDYASEIYTAKKLKLISGTAPDRFSPNASIEYVSAIKVIVGLLGYSDYAIVSGGYPAGYLKTASQLDLINSGIDTSSNLTMADALNLIFNALHTNINKLVSIKGDIFYSEPAANINILTQYYGYSLVEGIVQASGYHSVINDEQVEKNTLIISGYTLKNELAECEDYLGCSVECWYDEDTNEAKAIYLKSDNKILKISSDDISDYSNFKLTYAKNEFSTASCRIARGYTFVLNGRPITPGISDFVYENGELTLIDNNGDNLYDVVLSVKNEYFMVSSINSYLSSVYDKNSSTKECNLENTDEKSCVIYKYTASGDYIMAEFEDISVGSVITINRSRDGKLVKAVICDLFINGTVDEIADDGVIINGVKYKTNSYFDTTFNIHAGMNAEFILACDGTLTAVKSDKGEKVEYGYFLDFATDAGGLDRKSYLKILTHENKIKIYTLADKIKLDGSPCNNPSDSLNSLLMKDGAPLYQLIRYSLNEDDMVNLIDTSKDIAPNENIEGKYNFRTESDDSLTKYLDKKQIYYRESNVGAPYFSFAGTLIFRVPKALANETGYGFRYADDSFRVGSTSHLVNASTPTVDAYDYDESFAAGVVVMYDGTGGAVGSVNVITPSATAAAHLVEYVTDGLDADGGTTKVIHTYSNGKFSSYAVASELLLALSSKIPGPGDIVRFSYNTKGDISGIGRDVIYNKTNKKLSISYGSSNLSSSTMSQLTYLSGKVVSNSENSITIMSDNYPSTLEHKAKIDNLSTHMYFSGARVAIYNTDSGLVEHGNLNKINSVLNSGMDNASYVCAKMDYFSVNLVVIYK